MKHAINQVLDQQKKVQSRFSQLRRKMSKEKTGQEIKRDKERSSKKRIKEEGTFDGKEKTPTSIQSPQLSLLELDMKDDFNLDEALTHSESKAPSILSPIKFTPAVDWQNFVDRYFPKTSNQLQKNLKQLLSKGPRKVNRDMLKRAYDGGKIHKLGTLQKQGGRIKTWHSRFFVLRAKVLFYFESKDAFENGDAPRGWIFIREMQPKRSTGFVCQPTPFFAWRGKVWCFTIDSVSRTLVICARNKEERLEWMRAIQTAFLDFWSAYGLKVPVAKGSKIKEATGGNVSHKDSIEEEGAIKSKDDRLETLDELLPIAEQLDTFDILEESELEERTRKLVLAKCLIRWKAAVQIMKLENKYDDVEV